MRRKFGTEQTCVVCCDNGADEPNVIVRMRRRTLLTCETCQHVACFVCVRRYVLSHRAERCMNCSRRIDRTELHATFGRRFMRDEFRAKRCRTLLDDELAIVERTKTSRLRNVLFKCTWPACDGFVAYGNVSCGKNCGRVFRVDASYRPVNRSFVCYDCYWLTTAQRPSCTRCERIGCDRCETTLDDVDNGVVANDATFDEMTKHRCQADALDNVRLLLRTTKTCPSCIARIEKRDGCDQMYCVRCRTSFSWSTLVVDDSEPTVVGGGRIVHNPHYVQMVTELGLNTRSRGDAATGIPDIANIAPLLLIDFRLVHAHQLCHRICAETLREYENNDYGNNEHLRANFVAGTLTESAFSVELYARENRAYLNKEIHDILCEFVIRVSRQMTALIDATYRALNEPIACRWMVAPPPQQPLRRRIAHPQNMPPQQRMPAAPTMQQALMAVPVVPIAVQPSMMPPPGATFFSLLLKPMHANGHQLMMPMRDEIESLREAFFERELPTAAREANRRLNVCRRVFQRTVAIPTFLYDHIQNVVRVRSHRFANYAGGGRDDYSIVIADDEVETTLRSTLEMRQRIAFMENSAIYNDAMAANLPGVVPIPPAQRFQQWFPPPPAGRRYDGV